MRATKANPKIIRLFFFWSGIIATFAYRVIIVLNFYSPLWVKISWYVGTIGFILYFWHRFAVARKRARLILKHKLIEAVEQSKEVEGEQKQALQYIVKTSLTSKSKWNSGFIFALSVLALIVGIILDLI